MRYIPPFDVVKKLVDISTSKGQLMATASYDSLMTMIKLLLSGVEVDEDWYVKQYPDVAQAMAEGKITSPRQHFIDNGYFEGRLPCVIRVDEKWYQREYPDVGESIKKGVESSAQHHFDRDGYREGRLPHAM